MKHVLLSIFLLSNLALTAQTSNRNGAKGNYLEAGFLFGLTSYSGDVSEKAIDLSEIHPGYGAYLRYHFNNHFSSRVHVYSGAVSGDDANSSSLKNRKIRFSSNIVELGLVGEWVPNRCQQVFQYGRAPFFCFSLCICWCRHHFCQRGSGILWSARPTQRKSKSSSSGGRFEQQVSALAHGCWHSRRRAGSPRHRTGSWLAAGIFR